MNIREKIRQIRLDIAIDKINRRCDVLAETGWPEAAAEIRSHIAYIVDAEMQRRIFGITIFKPLE